MAYKMLTSMSGFSCDGQRTFSLNYGERLTRDELESWGVNVDVLMDTLQATPCDDSEVPEGQDRADSGPGPTPCVFETMTPNGIHSEVVAEATTEPGGAETAGGGNPSAELAVTGAVETAVATPATKPVKAAAAKIKRKAKTAESWE